MIRWPVAPARERSAWATASIDPLTETLIQEGLEVVLQLSRFPWGGDPAAWLKDVGRPFGREASMAKVYATEACNAIAARAVQIFGGYGYSRKYAVERYYRDARVTTIYEGTSEIQRMVVAKNLLAGR